MTLQLHLLQGVKSVAAATNHEAIAAPMSVHILICPAAGIRSPLHEYMNKSPASHCRVRASVGMVTALACAATGVAQTK